MAARRNSPSQGSLSDPDLNSINHPRLVDDNGGAPPPTPQLHLDQGEPPLAVPNPPRPAPHPNDETHNRAFEIHVLEQLSLLTVGTSNSSMLDPTIGVNHPTLGDNYPELDRGTGSEVHRRKVQRIVTTHPTSTCQAHPYAIRQRTRPPTAPASSEVSNAINDLETVSQRCVPHSFEYKQDDRKTGRRIVRNSNWSLTQIQNLPSHKIRIADADEIGSNSSTEIVEFILCPATWTELKLRIANHYNTNWPLAVYHNRMRIDSRSSNHLSTELDALDALDTIKENVKSGRLIIDQPDYA